VGVVVVVVVSVVVSVSVKVKVKVANNQEASEGRRTPHRCK
jgi:hypothetical protein